MYDILENNKFSNRHDSHAKLQTLWLEAHYQVSQSVSQSVSTSFEWVAGRRVTIGPSAIKSVSQRVVVSVRPSVGQSVWHWVR